ncbi:hypothetical protein, conserved [Trypanosoma brucei gambiense DAL972]|uniref:Uncharacterized protein n=1 Tax=Trypanosoma brucei gambiense (strain MHOM/CI/86/DAL972) TaxID=679716 RepID=D0A1D4_TRYB9|nr:hypothetical protein, conserved [Trypanosoma brucei gambiense DAL972]CBH15076.1 hypothetical protein, conserved [Trypanosoma brucei gambiense DAL972]|eukprot:XP_011777342.1 hypothetical protein, conserved [Trypanosoma brucei gambiense DAL972]
MSASCFTVCESLTTRSSWLARNGWMALPGQSRALSDFLAFLGRISRCRKVHRYVTAGCICVVAVTCAMRHFRHPIARRGVSGPWKLLKGCQVWLRRARSCDPPFRQQEDAVSVEGSFCSYQSSSITSTSTSSTPLSPGATLCVDEDVNSTDVAERSFDWHRRRLERKYVAPLLLMLAEVECVGQRLLHAATLVRGAVSVPAGEKVAGAKGSSVKNEEAGSLRKLLHIKTMDADDLLTQLITQLTMIPVGENLSLKLRREALMSSTSVFAECIAKWMYLPPGTW